MYYSFVSAPIDILYLFYFTLYILYLTKIVGYVNSRINKINKIAIDTSSEIVQKLIGAEVNNSSISAIVDDLSKRSGNKYYGN